VKRCFFGNAQVVNSSPPLAPNTFAEQQSRGLFNRSSIKARFQSPTNPAGEISIS